MALRGLAEVLGLDVDRLLTIKSMFSPFLHPLYQIFLDLGL